MSFSFYVNLYAVEETLKLNYAHKLSKAHISPNSFQKMNVALATQLFSNHVAYALKEYRGSLEHAHLFEGNLTVVELHQI